MPSGNRGTMLGVVLPGNSTAVLQEFPVPSPGFGQVLLKVKASSICGSDIRAIYREHVGEGAEGYQDVIAGHEPAGEIVAVGEGCKSLRSGDRVLVYHIHGCGMCRQCRKGYMIGCTAEERAAYGWQRDGGHAEYLLAEEVSCIKLPPELGFLDGALISCGFGTAYEALLRCRISGLDSLLVVGLGPVGLAVAMLGRAMGAKEVLGLDISAERRDLAESLGVLDRPEGPNGIDRDSRFDVVVECSGSAAGRSTAIERADAWGRVALVGEGPDMGEIDVSSAVIHKQLTIYGSWVTSIGHMADLVEKIARWGLRPSDIVTDTFELERADEAYRVACEGGSGKVSLVMP